MFSPSHLFKVESSFVFSHWVTLNIADVSKDLEGLFKNNLFDNLTVCK